MNAGFENVNHGWGDQYKEGYERKRKELFQQQEFLEDE
jgi:hypothetical protein